MTQRELSQARSNLPAVVTQQLAIAASINPQAVDVAVRDLLPAPVRQALHPRTVFPTGGDPRTESYEFDSASVSPEDVTRALAVLTAAATPPRNDEIIAFLTEIRLLCRGRDLDEAEMRAQTMAYARRLKLWPVDAVVYVLRQWPVESQWFPAWHELETRLDEVTRDRSLMRHALERALRAAPLKQIGR